MQIRAAGQGEYTAVKQFYDDLTDAMQDAAYPPGWEKEVYPAPEFLLRSIGNSELYIGIEEGRIAACMVLNHSYNDGYRTARWSVSANDRELLVIHALGVHPAFAGKGMAKQMVGKAIAIARGKHIRTIRLDVLGGNLPAERVYAKMGFTYVDTVPMYYEDTGWTDYKLFEYII